MYFLEESIALKREIQSSPVVQTLLNLVELSSVSFSYGNLLVRPAPTVDPMDRAPFHIQHLRCVCQAQSVKE